MNHQYTAPEQACQSAGRFSRISGLIILLLIMVASTGCMRRRVTVRSNPPGALLFVDNNVVGTTPASFYMNYYGTREIRLIKDGFKTVVEKHTFNAPWYQIPPLDLVTDNFLFREQRDERVLNIILEPMPNVNTRILQEHANALRRKAHEGIMTTPVDRPPIPQPYPPIGVPGDGLQ